MDCYSIMKNKDIKLKRLPFVIVNKVNDSFWNSNFKIPVMDSATEKRRYIVT